MPALQTDTLLWKTPLLLPSRNNRRMFDLTSAITSRVHPACSSTSDDASAVHARVAIPLKGGSKKAPLIKTR